MQFQQLEFYNLIGDDGNFLFFLLGNLFIIGKIFFV